VETQDASSDVSVAAACPLVDVGLDATQGENLIKILDLKEDEDTVR